jgi:hemolysin III
MHPGERFNASTHLLGLAVATACSAALLVHACARSDAMTILGIALFSAAAILLYASSAAFHSTRGPVRALLERLDHGAIFVLIAGTYTPFALASPRQDVNLVLLALFWIAAVRVSGKALASALPPALWLYVALGWGAVAAALPIALRTSVGAGAFLLLGALIYSSGTLFYLNRMGWRHAHGFWHLCVLGGTVAHFAAVTHLVA